MPPYHPHPLLERAITHERSGAWDAALDAFDGAWREAIRLRDLELLGEVIWRRGHCVRRIGRSEEARDLFDLSLAVADGTGDPRLAASALNGTAILLQEAGDIAAAEVAYRGARDRALQAADEGLAGEAEHNLGILANIRGNHGDALRYYLSGLRHLEAAGNERGCAAALNNLGMLHVDLRDLRAAEGFFDRALAICERIGDVVTACGVHINRTELFIALGFPDRARASCDEGFEIASRLGDQPARAEALKFYGVIYRQTGKLHLAEIHLAQAIELATSLDPLLEAEAQREFSLVLRAQSRNREAMEALNRSHALFTALQARGDQDDIRNRIGQLENDFLSLVRYWGESIEAKDRYTSGHCERVAEYACRLALEAGLSEREIVWFRMGAFLHDLGKTEVPAEILNKPGRLTDEERRVMERHTVIGDEMLASVEFPWDIRPMVRSHHERWDGKGYPDGLAGEAIPLSARILRVADVFDALTTARSYRGPLTPHEALALMEGDDGSFDPAVFALFRRIFPDFVDTARHAATRAAAESDERWPRAAGGGR